MAKDIKITPSPATGYPEIVFQGLNGGDIKLEVRDDGAVAFVGSSGTLFSIVDDLTGVLWSVNNISGLPVLEVSADNSIQMGEFGNYGFVLDNTGKVTLNTTPFVNTDQIWHAGNDGGGSGLDADLLDGQEGSYYRNASNINAGTIGDAYLPATISSNITGNAATATAWATGRTISLTSDVTGTSGAWTGSANLSFAATIANDSVTYAKMQNAVSDEILLGNIAGAGGIITELTPAQVRTMLGIEAGADNYDYWEVMGDTGDIKIHTMEILNIVGGTNVTTALTGASSPYTLTINSTDQYTGTVTSVGMSAPTGFSVSGSPVTTSGTLTLGFATGYSLPTNTEQSNWDTAYGWGDHAGLYVSKTGYGAGAIYNAHIMVGDGGVANRDYIRHDDTANAWHFVSDGYVDASGNSALYAGNIYMSSNLVATQSWVNSQGFLTSETDSQTLSYVSSTGVLTISNGNNVDLGVGSSDSPTFVRATLSQATGTAPLTVTSTTVVTNLNADLLDGQHGSYYTLYASGEADAVQGNLDSHVGDTSNPHAVTKSQVGLGSVENTALSTWAGSSNITTVGTLSSGTIPWSLIDSPPTYDNYYRWIADSDLIASFSVTSETTVNFVGGTAISTASSGTGPFTITFNHSTAAGYKHIPSGGASGQYLKWSASGTAVWDTVSAGEVGAEPSGAVATHAALTTGVHGVTGTILGTEDVDDTPANGATTAPVSSNWAYDHTASASAHHTRYADSEAVDAIKADAAWKATNWDNAYSHISSTGADHSYINQSVTTAATPSFTGLTLTERLTINVSVAGDGGWDNAGILIQNLNATAGEVAVAWRNISTSTNYWIQGLNQSEVMQWAYGTSFTGPLTVMELTTGGNLSVDGTITWSGGSSGNANTAYTHSQVTTGNPHAVTKANVGLSNVENTALSTWAGTTNISTVGSITGHLKTLENLAFRSGTSYWGTLDHTNTADRTYTFPNAAGTVALQEWVTSQNYSTTTGTVTSVSGTGTVSGITLTGTVTTSGNLTLGGTVSISSSNITDVDAFSQSGTYASLRAQATTYGDVGAAPSSHALSYHSDVTITSIASGEILKWSGTAWINNTLAEAGIAAASHSHSYDNYQHWVATGDTGSVNIGSVTELIFVGGTNVSTALTGAGPYSLTINSTDQYTGTVTSVAAGNGLNFTTITGSGSVVLGTPGSLSSSTSNGVTSTSHTHAITNYALSGTVNQITVTGAGKVLGAATTLSLPQDINTTSSPSFSGLALTGISEQASEATALTIAALGGAVGYRELGSLAFSSATYDNYNYWKLVTDSGGVNLTSTFELTVAGGSNVSTSYATNTLTIDVSSSPVFSGSITSTGVYPGTDNTGAIGNSTYTWNNGQFTNLTIDSTLNVRAAIDLADSDVLRLGSSDDVKFWYNGSTNYLQIEMETTALGIQFTNNGTEVATLSRSAGNLSIDGEFNSGHIFSSGRVYLKAGTAFYGIFDHANTAERTYTLPDASGTVPVIYGTASQNYVALWKDANTLSSSSGLTFDGSKLVVTGAGLKVDFNTAYSEVFEVSNYASSNQLAITGMSYLRFQTHVVPYASASYDIGASSVQWRNGYFSGTLNMGFGNVNDDFDIGGALTKGSGSFRIPYPGKEDTHELWHSFVESPTAGDNLYRWTVHISGKAKTIDLPEYHKVLNEDYMVWVSPVDHFGSGYGKVRKDNSAVDVHVNQPGDYNILVIATRKDRIARNSWMGDVRPRKDGHLWPS